MSFNSEIESALLEFEAIQASTFEFGGTTYACSASSKKSRGDFRDAGILPEGDTTLRVRGSIMPASLVDDVLVRFDGEVFRVVEIEKSNGGAMFAVHCALVSDVVIAEALTMSGGNRLTMSGDKLLLMRSEYV